MKFTVLLRSIEKNLDYKINGTSQRIKKADNKFIPRLEYSLTIYNAVKCYYEVVMDDEERAARATFNKVNKVLKDKIMGSSRNEPITDERLAGIKLAMKILRMQRKYHMLQLKKVNK